VLVAVTVEVAFNVESLQQEQEVTVYLHTVSMMTPMRNIMSGTSTKKTTRDPHPQEHPYRPRRCPPCP
jgi:hypothetical protein